MKPLIPVYTRKGVTRTLVRHVPQAAVFNRMQKEACINACIFDALRKGNS